MHKKKNFVLAVVLLAASFLAFGRTAFAFSFAIIGDTQEFSNSKKGGLQQAVKQISKKNVDVVMAVGDLVNSCFGDKKCEKKYVQWKKIMGGLMSKTYSAVGNHDRSSGSAEVIWQKVFQFPTNGPTDYSEETYSFDYDNAHFVVMDTEKPNGGKQINAVQRQWLENDLASNTKENIFIFYHEPAFPTSTDIGSGDSQDKHPAERDAFWSIVDKYNVTAVFNGHEHFFSKKTINSSVFPGAVSSINQFTVGRTDVGRSDKPKAGQADYFYTNKTFAVVQVDGKQITLNLYTVKGKLVKSFTFSK